MANEKNAIINTGSVFNIIFDPKKGQNIRIDKQRNFFDKLVFELKINIEIKIIPSIGSKKLRELGLNLLNSPLNKKDPPKLYDLLMDNVSSGIIPLSMNFSAKTR